MKSSILLLFMCIGSIAINGQDTVRICAEPIISGDKIELQIKVFSFESIASFQFAVAWEDSQYNFDSVGNFNATLSEAGQIAVNNETFNVPNNIELIRSLWFNAMAQGNTIEDGEILYSVFLTNTDPGVQGYFGIVEDVAFPIEFTNIVQGVVDIIEYEGTNCVSFRFGDLTSSNATLFRDGEIKILGSLSNGFIKIEINNSRVRSMNIFNPSGTAVQRFENLSEGTHEMELANATSGIYFLQFLDESGSILGVKKIQVLQ